MTRLGLYRNNDAGTLEVRMRFVLLLVAWTVVFTIGGCATQDTATEATPSENEGVAGAGSGPSRLNEHGGIAW